MAVDPNLEAAKELLEADTPDTEETSPPEEDTATAPSGPVIDWEKRHRDAAAKITELAEERAEYEERLSRYEEQLEALQTQTQPSRRQDWDDDDEYEDTRPQADPLADPRVATYLAKIDALEAREQERMAAEAEHATHSYVDNALDQIEAQYGVSLSDRAATWIGREALANPDPVTGRPDVEGAYAAFHAEMEEQKKAWVGTKPDGPAPISGPGAIEVPDLDDKEAHADWIDQRAAEWLKANGQG